MKTLYVVMEVHYEYDVVRWPVEIWDDKGVAEARLEVLKADPKGGSDDYEIEEIKLNKKAY